MIGYPPVSMKFEARSHTIHANLDSGIGSLRRRTEAGTRRND